MKNYLEIDGRIQSELVTDENCYAFNFSAPTGLDYTLKGEQRLKYTYVRVVYFGDKGEKLKKDLKVGKFIRIYGKLDSEKYITTTGKAVYNKVIVAEKIVELAYDEDRDCYEEYVQLC